MKNIDFSEHFVASRITSGNFFYPNEIEIDNTSITFIKPGIFNKIKKSVFIKNIAETEIVYSRLGFCKIKVIKKFGGCESVNGFRAEDADKIKTLIDDVINKENE